MLSCNRKGTNTVKLEEDASGACIIKPVLPGYPDSTIHNPGYFINNYKLLFELLKLDGRKVHVEAQ